MTEFSSLEAFQWVKLHVQRDVFVEGSKGGSLHAQMLCVCITAYRIEIINLFLLSYHCTYLHTHKLKSAGFSTTLIHLRQY